MMGHPGKQGRSTPRPGDLAPIDENDLAAAIFGTVGSLIVVLDPRGRIVRFNRACEAATGYAAADVEGRVFWDFLLPSDEVAGVKSVFAELKAGVFPNTHENHWLAVDGSRRRIMWSNTALIDSGGSVKYVVGTGIDVTERREAQACHDLTREILEYLTWPRDSAESLRFVITRIKDFAGLDAVAIRLHEGRDFPYFVVEGFSAAFVRHENFLCPASGDMVAAGAEGPVLECICGLVLRGGADPSKPFFTAGGSFWTGDSGAVRAVVTEEEIGARIRGRCLADGYNSIALVPIRAGDRIIGLLQLNDRRRGVFNPSIVSCFEQIGAGIGMAIKRQRAEEALLALNASLEQRVADRTAVAERRALQLKGLASQLTQAEERERRRIAMVLHDHLQQLLVAAGYYVGTAASSDSNPDCRAALAEARRILAEAVESSRSLAVELSPPVLHEAGLPAALDWLARQMSERHGLCVEVDADGVDLPPGDLRVLFFRAARELLLNVAKHAGANHARVSLSSRGPEVRLTVADDGAGFDPAAASAGGGTGLGLLAIAQRLEVLGGSIDVDAAPGRGTRVTLAAPLAAGDAEHSRRQG